MGFLLYKVDICQDQQVWTRVRPLSLARPQGALACWLRANRSAELPWRWELSGHSLMKGLVPEIQAQGHAIVMDLSPGDFLGANLCHVTRVAGFSQADESDVVIVMRELLRAAPSGAASELKARFTVEGLPNGPEIVETIGLSGGTLRGTYRWCAPQMNIGAAIVGSTFTSEIRA